MEEEEEEEEEDLADGWLQYDPPRSGWTGELVGLLGYLSVCGLVDLTFWQSGVVPSCRLVVLSSSQSVVL